MQIPTETPSQCLQSTKKKQSRLSRGNALAAYRRNEFSHTKVRAITRIATAANEAELIDMARRMTARHEEEHCKQRSNSQKASTAAANQAQENREFRIWRDDARGTVHFSIELSGEEAEQADGLVSVCRAFHDSSVADNNRSDDSANHNPQKSSVSTADHYQVVVHVDESALVGSETGKSQLPLESVRRLCCDGSIVPLVETASGEPSNVGRKVRTVTTAIRLALRARDKGCGFPGCSHPRFVDAHNIQHWADGGETSVENMLLLCSTHYKLVHEGGYSVKRDHNGEFFFRRPDGKAVPHRGYRLDDKIQTDAEFDAAGSESSCAVTDYLKNSREFFAGVGIQINESAAVYSFNRYNQKLNESYS